MAAADLNLPETSEEREILLYSFYRDAELRGSNLLFRLLQRIADPEAQVLLSEHLADETRHAWLWTERILELGGTPLAILDGYQARIGKLAGVPRDPVDLLALTVVVEQRALRRYQEHMKRDGISERTLEVLRAVSKDEGWHIDWVRKKGRELALASGNPERFEASLERFREVDRVVMNELEEQERELLGA